MATMGVKGGVASLQQTSAAAAVPQAAPQASAVLSMRGFSLDFSQPSTWVAALYVGSVAYLLGAYIMLGRYRVPL